MGKLASKAELRINEILSVAQSFFFQHGYDNTTVNIIIEAMQISKGAFYHYFKSKEDLLDKLVERFTNQILDKLQPIVEDRDLNALDKLNQVFIQSSIYKAGQLDFIMTLSKAIYSDKNLVLREKINQKSLQISSQLFAQILDQGSREGCFSIHNPQATAEMILLFGASIASRNAQLFVDLQNNPQNIQQLSEHLEQYRLAVERILAAPENSIKVIDETFLPALQNYIENKK